MAGGLEVIASMGWRTGPTATMLVFTLEYVKMLCALALVARLGLTAQWSVGYCSRSLLPGSVDAPGPATRAASGITASCGCANPWHLQNTPGKIRAVFAA